MNKNILQPSPSSRLYILQISSTEEQLDIKLCFYLSNNHSVYQSFSLSIYLLISNHQFYLSIYQQQIDRQNSSKQNIYKKSLHLRKREREIDKQTEAHSLTTIDRQRNTDILTETNRQRDTDSLYEICTSKDGII